MSVLVDHRLPKEIFPTHYTVHVKPIFSDFTFDGVVVMNVVFVAPVRSFALNSKNLVIKNKGLHVNNEDATFTEDKENEIIIIQKQNGGIINSGIHTISIEYEGILNDNMSGFYKSVYDEVNEKTGNKTKKYLATTQFESTDARQALPCFDEPNFKATFDVIITADENMTVLSNNSPKDVLHNNNGTKTVFFGRTPKMSTYLLAFVVGDLEYIEGHTKRINNFNSKIVRIYGTKGNKNKMYFALDAAIRGLEWYIEWFDIDYPLDKLDLIAIPDFSAGAMENWGLITFRECLLYVDDDTNLDEKQDIAITIEHELAHQWFGNLVTMEWWTYLWLNESMATYYGWRVTDELYPEWKIWNKFIEQEYVAALELDSLESSHPIEVSVKRTNEIQNIFDAISYSKGSCLVRFLVSYLGEETFQKGMRLYMRLNEYKNTESVDLWNAFDTVLNDSNNKNKIRDLMSCWTKQTGYPVVKIYFDGTVLHCSQEIFLKQGRNDKVETLWTIPIELTFVTPNGLQKKMITLDKKEDVYVLPELVQTNSYSSYSNTLFANVNRTAFYRTQYETMTPNFELLVPLTGTNTLTYGLDDSFSLAFSGYQGFDIPFGIINSLDLSSRGTRDYSLWHVITTYFNTLDDLIEGNNDVAHEIKGRVTAECNNLSKIIDEITWEQKPNEDVNDTDLRELALNTLVRYENHKTIQHALTLFHSGDSNNWISKKYVVLKAVGKNSDENDYNNMVDMLKNTTNSQLKDALMVGIGSVKINDLIRRSVELIFSDLIRNQDIISFIRILLSNKDAKNITRSYLYNNWSRLLAKYTVGSSEILSLIKVMGIGYKTEEDLITYTTFFKTYPDGSEMAIKQTIERIQSRIMIIDRIVNDPVFL